jgi:hypothetical protein
MIDIAVTPCPFCKCICMPDNRRLDCKECKHNEMRKAAAAAPKTPLLESDKVATSIQPSATFTGANGSVSSSSDGPTFSFGLTGNEVETTNQPSSAFTRADGSTSSFGFTGNEVETTNHISFGFTGNKVETTNQPVTAPFAGGWTNEPSNQSPGFAIPGKAVAEDSPAKDVALEEDEDIVDMEWKTGDFAGVSVVRLKSKPLRLRYKHNGEQMFDAKPKRHYVKKDGSASTSTPLWCQVCAKKCMRAGTDKPCSKHKESNLDGL